MANGTEAAAVPPTTTALGQGNSWTRVSLALAARAAGNPALGLALLRVAWRFRARHWYRRAPWLPLPAREYVRWRMYTAYGDANAVPPVADVVRYARWATHA